MKLKTCKNDPEHGIKNFISGILQKEFAIEATAYPHTDLDDFENAYGGPREIFYCLMDHETIAGTVAVKTDDDTTALLRRLFVGGEYRGKGYGKKLIEAALDFCVKHRYRKVCFRCTERMKQAMNLCQDYGFVESEKVDFGAFTFYLLVKEIKPS